MKKSIFLTATAMLLIFSAFKNDTDLHKSKPLAGPPIIITQAIGTCNANPLITPSPGIRITLQSLSYSYYFTSAGSRKVWIKRSSASVWSSCVVTTPTTNPFSVTYGSCTPSLGAVAPGTLMDVAITGLSTATCPDISCGAGAVSNFATFTAADCSGNGGDHTRR
jgi:hypothetical protein